MTDKNKISFVLILLLVNLFAGLILAGGNPSDIDTINNNINSTSYSNKLSAINSNTTQNMNSGASSVDNVQTDRNYFANALEIGESELNEELIRNFSERRNSDNENLQDVIKLAKLIRAEKRSKISEELLNLKREFIRRMNIFSNRNLGNRENIKIQIQKYQEILEKKKEIRLNMSNDKINEFLMNKNRNPQNFINSLLN